MTAVRCDCSCRGCRNFHLGIDPTQGEAAHHTRLLMAFDLSLAAACRARGIPACDGQEDDDPHATDGCDIGMLHARAAELAIALAAAIEDPGSRELITPAERATDALDALLRELARVIGDRPSVP